MATINSVQAELASMHARFEAHVLEDRAIFERLEERLHAYEEQAQRVEASMTLFEQQASENKNTLARIEQTVNRYEAAIHRFIGFLKWTAGIVGTALIGEGLLYLVHLIHP